MPRKIMKPEYYSSEESEQEQQQQPIQQQPVTKPKRQITEAQREHLNNIRKLALEKKRQLKEITLKSKLAKTVEKEDLAKKYDDYVAKKQQPPKPELKPQKPKKKVKRYISESETEESEESEVEEIIVKKKKKPVKKVVKKKIVYESETESESEEEVVVRKKKPLNKLLYDNTKQDLHNHILEERIRHSINGYGNALGV
jgi:hypothetical protein